MANLNCASATHRPRSSHLLERRERGPFILNPKTELIPYRQKLECQVCRGVFPSYPAFSKHYLLQHKLIPEDNLPKYELSNPLKCPICKKEKRGYGYDPETPIKRFNYVIINGDYIERRLEYCKSKETLVAPNPNLYQESFLKNEGGVMITEWNVPRIIQKCSIRICPKCVFSRFLKIFDKYFPFIDDFKEPKLLTLEVKEHCTLSLDFKIYLEQKFRNFIRNLERDLRKNPRKFLSKKWLKRKRRAGKRGKRAIERAIKKYKNFYVRYLRVLSLKKTREDMPFYYHFHLIIDLPFIEAKKLTKYWSKQVGSSLDIRKIKFKKKSKNFLKKTSIGRIILKRYPRANPVKLRVLYYVTKYIVNQGNFLNPDEYARFAYGKCFVQQSHRDKFHYDYFTKLGIQTGTFRQKFFPNFQDCPEFDKMSLTFLTRTRIQKKPPPKNPQKTLNFPFPSSQPSPKSPINRLMQELNKNKYLSITYIKNHYDNNLIHQLLKKGLLIKSSSKIYPN